MKTGTEGDGTLLGVDLDITENLVEVGGDDDVDGLDGTREVLVKVLLAELELEKSAVDLVDDKDGLDALTESLTEHGLGLNADTLDGVDDDESTVSDTESGGNLRREINVTGDPWLTGTAGWMYTAATQWILGIRPGFTGLRIDPCIPEDWPEFQVTRKWRGATYHITVKNPERVQKGIKSITLNGKPVKGEIPPQAAGGTYEIEVIMGRGGAK